MSTEVLCLLYHGMAFIHETKKCIHVSMLVKNELINKFQQLHNACTYIHNFHKEFVSYKNMYLQVKF